jgi:hypothetical protein
VTFAWLLDYRSRSLDSNRQQAVQVLFVTPAMSHNGPRNGVTNVFSGRDSARLARPIRRLESRAPCYCFDSAGPLS